MRVLDELRWIRHRGLVAWLTWASVEQACGAPLTLSQRFWRGVLSTSTE